MAYQANLFLSRRPAEGVAVVGAGPPFNFSVYLSVLRTCGSIDIGLCWLLQQVAKQRRLGANRQIEHSTYLPLKESKFVTFMRVCVLSMRL